MFLRRKRYYMPDVRMCRGVEPSRPMRTYIQYHLRVDDILDEDAYIEKMLIIRHRILAVFARYVDPKTKKGVFGNYIMGIGPKVQHLVGYMIKHMKRDKLFSKSDLPPKYRDLSQFWLDLIYSRVTDQLIERQINLLIQTSDLWRLEISGGIWEISQSVADEYKSARELAGVLYREEAFGSLLPDYRNERTFHGRPSRQGRRRSGELRVAPSLSTSL